MRLIARFDDTSDRFAAHERSRCVMYQDDPRRVRRERFKPIAYGGLPRCATDDRREHFVWKPTHRLFVERLMAAADNDENPLDCLMRQDCLDRPAEHSF